MVRRPRRGLLEFIFILLAPLNYEDLTFREDRPFTTSRSILLGNESWRALVSENRHARKIRLQAQ